LRTLSDLEKDILDDQDRVLFHEAVMSAGCNARRGAYILIWISCAESLKRRFAEVSSRDGVAKHVSGEIERKEKAHAAIDVYVLDESRKYGFIDDPGHARLSHIYEMRCVYGHPYELQPSEEDLVAAGAAVSELVLHQPLLLRHGYLQEQVRLLTTDLAFLDDQMDAVAEYAKEVAVRTDPELIEWFIEKLWSAAEKLIADKTQHRYALRVVWFSSAFLHATSFDLSAHDVRPILSAFPMVGSSSLSHTALFPKLPAHAQDIVVGNLIGRVKTTAAGAVRLQALDEVELLTVRHRERFAEALAGVTYSVLAEAGIHVRYFAERLIADMKSHSWYTQNPAIDALFSAGPAQINGLNDDLQKQLGNNLLQCAEGTAGSAANFMESLAEMKAEWPAVFVEGIVSECFVNDDNAVRFKIRAMKEALLSLAVLDEPRRLTIVDSIQERMAGGTPKSPHRFEDSKPEAIAAINAAMSAKPDELEVLGSLRATIEGITVEEDNVV